MFVNEVMPLEGPLGSFQAFQEAGIPPWIPVCMGIMNIHTGMTKFYNMCTKVYTGLEKN